MFKVKVEPLRGIPAMTTIIGCFSMIERETSAFIGLLVGCGGWI
jgi:hypothetical protein